MPRLVYLLLFETEREPGAEIIEFVVPLTHRPEGAPPRLDSEPRPPG